ncbi:MAG: hypothetical protein QF464_04325 [Myxococcota bacterium]|nr:hypothetical protein [Myxococcota bacterium]
MSALLALGAMGACAGPGEDPVGASPDVPGCLVVADCDTDHVCIAGECQPVDPTYPGNEPPTISIVAPSDDDFFHVGASVTLEALVTDDAEVSALTVRWQTNRGGDLGQAAVDADGHAALVVDDLLSGDHILTVTVKDAEALAAQATVSIVVDGRPSRPVIRLSPEAPTTADDLTVTIVHEATDENRGSHVLGYRYRWFVDHVERDDLHAPTVPHTATLRGQSWTVRVSATDPYGYGDEAPASVIIGNALPTCDEAVLLPQVATTTTSLTCLCPNRDDPDHGDLELDTCAFYDGTTLLDEVSAKDGACVLAAANTARGMSVRCLLTPTDESEAGETVMSSQVLVDNSHPAAPAVAISPDSGTVLESFTCGLTTPSTDADGDDITYETAWYVNDYPNAAPNPFGVSPLDLVRDGTGAKARGGDALRCEIHARDSVGELSAPGVSQTIIIGNTPPFGGVCAMTPTEGVTATSVINCEATNALDIDADPISWTFEWTVTGPVVDPNSNGGALIEATTYPPVTGSKLSGAYFDRGSLVSCVATPTDGVASGEPVDCGEPVLVENTMPIIWEVLLEPLEDIDCNFPGFAGDAECTGAVTLDQPVTCGFHGWYDPDTIDVVEVFYSWVVFEDTEVSLEDEESGGFGPTMVPAAAGLEPGDVFTCIARPYNGEDEGEGVYATHSATVVASP